MKSFEEYRASLALPIPFEAAAVGYLSSLQIRTFETRMTPDTFTMKLNSDNGVRIQLFTLNETQLQRLIDLVGVGEITEAKKLAHHWLSEMTKGDKQ